MTRQFALAVIAAGIVLGTLPGAQAAQYNQRPFIDPAGHSKIMTTIAKMQAFKAQDRKQSDDDKAPRCGEERNGFVIDRRANGEVVIVATRDVIATGGADVEIGRECRR